MKMALRGEGGLLRNGLVSGEILKQSFPTDRLEWLLYNRFILWAPSGSFIFGCIIQFISLSNSTLLFESYVKTVSFPNQNSSYELAVFD